MVLGFGDTSPYSLQSAFVYYYDEILKVTVPATGQTFITKYYTNGLYMDLGEAGKVKLCICYCVPSHWTI